MTLRRMEKGKRKKREGRPSPFSFFLLPFAFCLLTSGCRNGGEKVEAELRRRDAELREVRDELCQAQLMNESLQRELHHIEQTVPVPGGVEAIHAIAGVKDIVLGRQTGGYREDCGDSALQVILEPRDCENHTIKAPGLLRVYALEIGTDGIKKPLTNWEVPPEKLSRLWKSGLWSSGYTVILPWNVWPTTEKLRVVAQFVLPDGRTFEADKDITIRLPSAEQRKSPSLPPSPPPSAPPAAPTETLPPPKPFPTGGDQGPSLSEARYRGTTSIAPGAVQLGRPQR